MNKRIISLILSVTVLLVILLVALPAYAEESNVFLLKASSKTASPGDTITYTLSLKNSKSITAFGLNIVVPDGLTLLEDDEDSVQLNVNDFGSTLEFVQDNDHQVLWYSEDGEDFTNPKEVEIISFECKIPDDAPIGSTYVVTLENILEAAGSDYNYDEISSQIAVTPHTLSIADAPSGFEVSGTITSFNSDTDDITVQLFAEGSETAAYTATVKGNTAAYSIKGVSVGNYTMKVSKNNHVTRDYTVVVGTYDVTQDAKIHLKGDINGDGKANAVDKRLIYNHMNDGDKALTDYEFNVADINGDGKVNAVDKRMIYNHMNDATKALW